MIKKADVYSPTVSYGDETSTGFRVAYPHMDNHSHRIPSSPHILGDDSDDKSDWYIKYSDYEYMVNKYLELQHMLDCLEKEKKDE